MRLVTTRKVYEVEKKSQQKIRQEKSQKVIISTKSPANNSFMGRLFGVKNTQITIKANSQEAKINYNKVLGNLKQAITDPKMDNNKAWLIDERLTIVSVAINQGIDHAHVGNELKTNPKERDSLLKKVKIEYSLGEDFFNTNSQEGLTNRDLSHKLTQSSVRIILQSDKYINGKLAKVYPQFVKGLSTDQYQKIDLEKKKIKDVVIETLMDKICTEVIFGEKLLPMDLSSLNKTVKLEAERIMKDNREHSVRV